MAETRLDRWLFAARFFKSRTLAAGACDGGKVHVNGHAARPARLVRPGDELTVTLPRSKRIVRVSGVADRRGPASVASALYEDLTPPAPPRSERVLPPMYRPPGAGRPTKRERRLIDRVSRDL
ncbi:MAG TPA: RNA-binding S4 domain-containing protein [Candidatus Binatia bacterium]|nr:RNA-binding S4 domain-containing protein [Candidatus Binatia bacterium]